MSGALRRRDFLGSLAGFLLTCFSLALPGCSLSGESRSRKKAGELLSSFFRDGDMAARIGREYVLASGDSDRESIVRAICDTLPGGSAALMKADPKEQRRIVARRIAKDFEEDSTVEVGGWLLSLTEARLCALALT